MACCVCLCVTRNKNAQPLYNAYPTKRVIIVYVLFTFRESDYPAVFQQAAAEKKMVHFNHRCFYFS